MNNLVLPLRYSSALATKLNEKGQLKVIKEVKQA